LRRAVLRSNFQLILVHARLTRRFQAQGWWQREAEWTVTTRINWYPVIATGKKHLRSRYGGCARSNPTALRAPDPLFPMRTFDIGPT
jgi:hypothetical protein